MTMNDVIWRQACTIQQNATALVDTLSLSEENRTIAEQIETQTAIVLCAASCASSPDTPLCLYDGILAQVGQLQSFTWSVLKACADSPIAILARKLYDACANMKKRLRRKLETLKEQAEAALQATNTMSTMPLDANLVLASACT